MSDRIIKTCLNNLFCIEVMKSKTIPNKLASEVWGSCSSYESLQSGKAFSSALKSSFSKLKSLKVKEEIIRKYLSSYCEIEISQAFDMYIEGMDDDEISDIQKVRNNQSTLIKAIKKTLSK